MFPNYKGYRNNQREFISTLKYVPGVSRGVGVMSLYFWVAQLIPLLKNFQ